MAKAKLMRFSVQNVKYALKTLGVWGQPKDLAFAHSISIEPDLNTLKLYGDGKVIGVLTDDKGHTGMLTVNSISKDYETDMKRGMQLANGYANIQQLAAVEHAIYFETKGTEDGKTIIIKTWLFNVTTTKPSETYEQTEDDPKVNRYEYPLVITGENLKTTDGLENYVDENGNEIMVYYLSAFPEDTDYDTFGNAVPSMKFVA